ncbi:MAG: SUMF1/EgtB/PvdO family nonheme iron enzyme, partial [Blastocatellia bacterium]
ECQCMVLLLSPDSMPDRKEVHREWFRFDQRGKTIYPLYLRDCELHSRFDSRNYIDARTDLPGALDRLLDALRRDLAAPEAADRRPDALGDFRRERIAEWSKPRYDLDKRFVNLTLLLDKGEQQMQRWQRAEDSRFNDLRDVLEKAKDDPALVLLGAPGSGKSTLLRRLQLDHSQDRLSDGKDEISFFIQLNGYRERAGKLPEPREWLAARWAAAYPPLPPLDAWLQRGKALLLLDALNEMPHKSADDYRELAGLWREFAQEAARRGNRILFSCRSLDYGGAFLSSPDLPMPQIEIQPMNAVQVREFLDAYVPVHADRVWEDLDGKPQFTLFQTPYFLKLLCDQIEATGDVPKGRAALFTGFVRQALRREIHGELFQPPGGLLGAMDHDKLGLNKWRSPFELPEGGKLIPTLSDLAYAMQIRGLETESAQVRLDYDDARGQIAHERPEDLINAGIALNVLDKDVAQSEILFFHQLLQEYFAARQSAKQPKPELIRVEWETEKVQPTLKETLSQLADGDPLPPLPQTGWEETTLTASPMAKDPAAFIRAIAPHNLPLAARCAASPEVKIGDELRREIQMALIERTQDKCADLRARIAAGEALGMLGDPRFERRKGPHGEYLLPPLVTIAGGTYPMGLDKSDYEDEKPAHNVKLAPFQIGRFPVTNAEYKLFTEAGGYDNEQWWDTEESRAWLSGEASTDGQKESWHDTRRQLLQMSEDSIRGLTNFTSEQKDSLIEIRSLTDEAFEQRLDSWFPSGKTYRQPEYWDDTRFNNPTQPVVGLTWFEARAYCNWLTANVAGDVIYRLPTEAEFEAAARGAKGRLFPYGKTFDSARCNTFESHIRRTTPVGIFDNSTTDGPEGAFDLSGNAYTWTLSIYDQEKFPYPYRSDDGREDIHQTDVKRVLRGGSWFFSLHSARSVVRGIVDRPAARFIRFGCRVVCVVRPPSLSFCP